MFSSEVDKRINAIVAPLATQLELLIQLVKELSERSSTRSTEGHRLSVRSRLFGQRSHFGCRGLSTESSGKCYRKERTTRD